MTSIRDLATGASMWALALEATGCKPTPTLFEPSPESATAPACPVATVETPKPPPGSPDDCEPPQVVGVVFDGVARITLNFSEPVEAAPSFNPRQFRVSHGYSSTDYVGNYESGRYYDLAYRYGYDQQIMVARIEQASPEQLSLDLSRAIPAGLCDNLRVAQDPAAAPDPNYKIRQGLFLHYTGRGSPGIRDLSHNPLGDIGGEWALDFGANNRSSTGRPPVARFDLLIELPCPTPGSFDGPPGPK